MATQTKAFRKRIGHKGDAEARIEEIEAILDTKDNSRGRELEALRSVLLDRFNKIQELDELILDEMCNDDTISEERMQEEVKAASDLCLRVQGCVVGIDYLLSRKDEASVHDSVSSINGGSKSRAKLPKISLETFSGNPQKWQSFWDCFESLIHSNEDLTHIDKFNYLRSTLSGDASSAIAGLAPTSENYTSAINILKERFAKKSLIISSHMDALMKLPQLTDKDDIKKLRKTYDRVETHIRSLQSLGVDSKDYGPLLVPVVMNHLSEDVNLIVSRKFKTSGDVWQLDDMLNTLKDEIEARERSGFVSKGSKSSKGDSSGSRGGDERRKGSGSALYTGGSDMSDKVCVYCNENHSPLNCKTVTDVEARRQHLKQAARCFNCLRSGYAVFRCKSKIRCRGCGGKHHESVCLKGISSGGSQDNSSKTKVDAGMQTDVSSTIVCNTATSVLMQTARGNVTSVRNGCRRLNVRLIFDSASHKTYVTNALRKALGLRKIGSKELKISRFMDSEHEGQSCVSHNSDIVQLCVQGKCGEDIVITAHTVPLICPPPSSQQIEFCKEEFDHLVDIDLADDGSDVAFRNDNIDILIGMDFYWTFMQDEIVRGSCGPVALKTTLGYVLSGPLFQSENTETTLTTCCLRANVEDQLDRVVEKLWKLDGVSTKDDDDNDVLKKFQESIIFNELSGRYQVSTLAMKAGRGYPM